MGYLEGENDVYAQKESRSVQPFVRSLCLRRRYWHRIQEEFLAK